MNLTQIFKERPDIAKRVYEEYPETSKEKRCTAEKSKRDGIRFERAKRYYYQTGKKEYESN